MKNIMSMNNAIPFPDCPVAQNLENFSRTTDRAFKDIFKGEIRGSFLIEIKSKVNAAIGPFLFQLYDFNFNNEKLATGFGETFEYEICKVIIGIHHANTVFLTKEEINAKTRDEKYKDELITQAVYHVLLRKYAAAFFRTKSIRLVERFNYYPVPYMLFSMCMRINELFQNKDNINETSGLISRIVDKSLAALSLAEDGFFDSAYMPCRTVIEIYIKLMLLNANPHLIPVAEKFAYYDLDKTNCSKEYPAEFNELFEKRKNTTCRNKIDYLHYGFVDSIDDYHDIVKQNPYSTSGIFAYLKEYADEEQFEAYDRLENLYKSCHGYTHGNVTVARFPLLHYFEISLILGLIVPRVYKMVCDIGCDQELYKEMMEKYHVFFDQLKEQYANRSTELFELETEKYR